MSQTINARANISKGNTYAYYAAPSNNSDALFRAWGKALSDAMAYVGLIKTNDSGQIDWNTVATPAAVNTLQGYEIWRFNDALQSSNPVYFRIDYGSQSGNKLYPRIDLQVGHGSNGSGTLTGLLSASFTVAIAAYGATLCPCFVSSDSGRINVAMFTTGVTNSTMLFYIERLKDDSGNPTASGVNIVTAAAARLQQLLPSNGSAYPASAMTGVQAAVPPSGNGSYGVNLGLFPILPNLGYAGNPDLGGIVHFSADTGSVGGITITVNLYGQNHTYITANTLAANNVGGNSTSNSIAIRYE